MKINIPLDYVSGYLRYGHLEGEVELDSEAEKEFKELLKKEINNMLTPEEEDKLEDYKEWIKDECDIIVDDYRIEDWGDPDWEVLLDV